MNGLEIKNIVKDQIANIIEMLNVNGASEEEILGALEYADALVKKETEDLLDDIIVNRMDEDPAEVIFQGMEIFTDLVRSDDVK